MTKKNEAILTVNTSSEATMFMNRLVNAASALRVVTEDFTTKEPLFIEKYQHLIAAMMQERQGPLEKAVKQLTKHVDSLEDILRNMP